MSPVASFHLVREDPWHGPVVMYRLGADRLALRGVAGLRFSRVLGTGSGTTTARSIDVRRSALFAVWDDERDLDRFVADHPVAHRWARADEVWHVRMRWLGGHGAWNGFDPSAVLGRAGAGSGIGTPFDGRVAVVTRARIRLGAWRRFDAASRGVDEIAPQAEGLLAMVGIGEAPVGLLGTFSLWRSLDDARSFAAHPRHADVARRAHDERWLRESMFARFEPYASTGSWNGGDPLADRPSPASR